MMRRLVASEGGVYIGVALVLIALAVFGRLLPHPPNFAPMAGVALFGGAVLPRRWAVVVPLAGMIASDLVLGLHPLFPLTWGCFALVALASNWGLKKFTPLSIASYSLGASLLFYLVTNFGVWLQDDMYSMTWAGLADCYAKALPFFRNTLLGDLCFSGLLFGLYALVYKLSRRATSSAVS
jgi:hypothetical protein